MNNKRLLLVGDNPFHGISHLSQEKAIARGKDLLNPQYAAGLVRTALDNGADGFMFSVSDNTLSILKLALAGKPAKSVKLYAIVPYVFEFVRMAVTEGGVPGLAKKVGREVVFSGNFGSIFQGVKGVVSTDPESLLRAYLLFEEKRIRSAAGKSGVLSSLFLHEVLTDMALGLDMDWLFRTHIALMHKRGIKPGIHTHNLPYCVNKFRSWGIDRSGLAFTTQYNSLGFGMSPSREECEAVLKTIPGSEVVAYGVLASGYLKVPEAAKYVKGLPQLTGLVFGVSKEQHALETFQIMQKELAIGV
jgi:hypothetical protein